MNKDSRYPLIEEIDSKLSTVSVFELIRNRPFSFFLDSGMDPEKLGRYSFIGSDPFLVFSSQGDEATITRGAEPKRLNGNPFDILGNLLEQYRLDSASAPVPFVRKSNPRSRSGDHRLRSRRSSRARRTCD